MADLATATGSKFFIGPVASETIDTAGEYAALAWTPIGLVRSFGEHGDQEEILRYSVVSDGRARKQKGISDAGDPPLICAHAPDDTGQAALLAASQTKNAYAFKVELPNRLTPTGTDEIRYFRVLIGKPRLAELSNDGFLEDTFPVAITSGLVIVPPTAGS